MDKITPNEVLTVISVMQNKGISHPSLNAAAMWGWIDKLEGLGVIFKNAHIPNHLLPKEELGSQLDLVLWDRQAASTKARNDYDKWALMNIGKFTLSLNPATLQIKEVTKDNISVNKLLEAWDKNIDF